MRGLKGTIKEKFHPEKSFVLSDQNKKKIKNLLVSLQKEKLALSKTEEASSSPEA
jgi:hypothetical protein